MIREPPAEVGEPLEEADGARRAAAQPDAAASRARRVRCVQQGEKRHRRPVLSQPSRHLERDRPADTLAHEGVRTLRRRGAELPEKARGEDGSRGMWRGPRAEAVEPEASPGRSRDAPGAEDVLAISRASGDHEDRRPSALLEDHRRVLRRAPVSARPSRQGRGRGRLEQIRGEELDPEGVGGRGERRDGREGVAADSKKSSSTPTRFRSSASRNALTTASSIGSRGATKGIASGGRPEGGAGSAARSTFPDGVRGSASRKTKVDGHIDAGSRCSSDRRNAESVGGSSGRRTTQAARRVPRGIASPPAAAFANPRDLEQRGLHLGGLHAVAAHLDARVLAAGVQEAAIRQQAPEIAGVEETPPGAAGHREKRRGRRAGILPVAEGERAGAHGDLALVRRLAALAIEQHDLGLVHRIPERGARRARACRGRPTSGESRSSRSRRTPGGRRRSGRSGCGRGRSRRRRSARRRASRCAAGSSSLPSSVAEKLRKTLGTECRIVMSSPARNRGSRRRPSPPRA